MSTRRTRHMARWAAIVAVAAATAAGALFGASCVDPVIDDQIAALGPDVTHAGPTHRPGQPCLLCHDGAMAPLFMAAGTVFATPDEKIGVGGVKVIITDARGKRFEKSTNCAGNFYVQENDGTIEFPALAEIDCTLPDGSTRRSVMGTRIDRDGSCAGCHVGRPSATSPGRVACAPTEPDPPFQAATSCQDGR